MPASGAQKGKAMHTPARRYIPRAACLALLGFLAILAPDYGGGEAHAEEKSPLSVGGYGLSGSTSLGYRFLTIDSGSKDFYREVVNLNLYSAHCHKGLCGHGRQSLPPGYATLNRRLSWTTLAIE